MIEALRVAKIAFFTALIVTLAASPGSAAENCPSDPAWLQGTPNVSFAKPPARPGPDCNFYTPAWQIFLGATRNVSSSGPYRPAFLNYDTIESMFGSAPAVFAKFSAMKVGRLSLAPRALKGSNDAQGSAAGATGKLRSKVVEINAGARQAGLNGLLVDQNGNPIFYSIHVNQSFADFVKTNFIKESSEKTKAAILAANEELTFPKGAVEFKSAWQIVPNGVDTQDYITAPATVPMLKASADQLVTDPSVPPRDVLVRLLSLHVVFVLEGHPEFIWATFEHVDKDGVRDLAPAASAMPAGDDGLPGGVDGPVATKDFPLYKANTPASQSMIPPTDAQLIAKFDPVTQTFTKGGVLQTSIYRRFPASKQSNSPQDNPEEDGELASLNGHLTDDFKAASADDRRRNYRLVGAVWLDKPEVSFKLGQALRNPEGVTGEDDGALVVGEDGLSSMAMESFTQDSFVNCLACHDARRVSSPEGGVLIEKKKINVSHVLSRYLESLK